MQTNDNTFRKSHTKKRYIYASREQSDLMKDVYLKHGSDAAMFYVWLTSTCHLIHDSGIADVSVRRLATASGFDDSQVTEVLSLLGPYGVHYDFEHEVIQVAELAHQYCGYMVAKPQDKRLKGLLAYLSTLPACPARDNILRMLPLQSSEVNRNETKGGLGKDHPKDLPKGLLEVVSV